MRRLFSVNEFVWVLEKNKVQQAKVHDFLQLGDGKIFYWLVLKDEYGNAVRPTLHFADMDKITLTDLYEQSKIFKTKQSLLKSL